MSARQRVYAVLADGAWHSEDELSRRCRTATPGAWARDLRKPQFGRFTVAQRRLNGVAEYRLDLASVTSDGVARVGSRRSSAVSRPLNRAPIVRWLSAIEETVVGRVERKLLTLYQQRLGLLDALIRFEFLEPFTLTVWLQERGWKVERETFEKRWVSPPPEFMEKEKANG